jgi:hypothetical protein
MVLQCNEHLYKSYLGTWLMLMLRLMHSLLPIGVTVQHFVTYNVVGNSFE